MISTFGFTFSKRLPYLDLLFYSLVAYPFKNLNTAEGYAINILNGPLGSGTRILKIEYERTLRALKAANDTSEWERIGALKEHRHAVILLLSIAQISWLIVV